MKHAVMFCVMLINVCTLFALTDAQRWALALTEIMTTVNHDSHDTLNFDELNEENKADYLRLLANDWDVHNRDELLDTIKEVETAGHKAALQTVKAVLQETPSLAFFTLLSEYKLSERYYNYFKFTLTNWAIFKERTIAAWDYGRCISLCRWGYDCGYLTEDEAWEKIFYYAKLIQPLYTSWEEYGFDYYMGRLFWASGFCEELSYAVKTDPIYRQLIGEGGYWAQLEWNIPLD